LVEVEGGEVVAKGRADEEGAVWLLNPDAEHEAEVVVCDRDCFPLDAFCNSLQFRGAFKNNYERSRSDCENIMELCL
jgi:hypothetical protein